MCLRRTLRELERLPRSSCRCCNRRPTTSCAGVGRIVSGRWPPGLAQAMNPRRPHANLGSDRRLAKLCFAARSRRECRRPPATAQPLLEETDRIELQVDGVIGVALRLGPGGERVEQLPEVREPPVRRLGGWTNSHERGRVHPSGLQQETPCRNVESSCGSAHAVRSIVGTWAPPHARGSPLFSGSFKAGLDGSRPMRECYHRRPAGERWRIPRRPAGPELLLRMTGRPEQLREARSTTFGAAFIALRARKPAASTPG